MDLAICLPLAGTRRGGIASLEVHRPDSCGAAVGPLERKRKRHWQLCA